MGTDRTRPTTDEAEDRLLADIAGAKVDDGGPAFPWHSDGMAEDLLPSPGMTLRDYFAAKAIGPMIEFGSKPEAAKAGMNGDNCMKKIAAVAYILADEMLRARKGAPK